MDSTLLHAQRTKSLHLQERHIRPCHGKVKLLMRLLAGLLVHVADLVKSGAGNVESHPANGRDEQSKESTNAVVASKLSNLLGGISVLSNQQGGSAEANTGSNSLVGLLAHVAELVEGRSGNVEQNPADSREQQSKESTNTVVTSKLGNLLGGISVLGNQQGGGAEAETSSESLVGLLAHVAELVEGGTSNVKQNPADSGEEQGQESTNTVVTSKLSNLLGGISVLGNQQGGGAEANTGSDSLVGLLAHVAELVESWTSNVKQNPADSGEQQGQESTNAVVTSNLGDLLGGISLLSNQQGGGAEAETGSESLVGLLAHVVDLVEGGTSNVEGNPANSGDKKGQEGSKAAISSSNLGDLHGGLGIAGAQEGGSGGGSAASSGQHLHKTKTKAIVSISLIAAVAPVG